MATVIGHKRPIGQLTSAIEQGRLSHALLMTGPRGVGKFTLACILARSTLCHDAPAPLKACGQCDSCRLIPELPDQTIENTHPDLHIIRKELAATSSNSILRTRKQLTIPVDLIREFIVGGQTSDGRHHDAPAYRTAALGHGKVFIIDEAELMDSHGQNALLKTLEEPPDGSLFMLISSSEDRLLVTIRSRAQRLGFGPLTDSEMSCWVDLRFAQIDPARAKGLLFFAEGSPGRFSMAERYGLDAWVRTVGQSLRKLESRELDDELGDRMAKGINEFAEAWVKEHVNASKDAANRRGAELMWSLVGNWIRRSLAKTVARCKRASLPKDDVEAEITGWLACLEALGRAESELASNVNLRMVTDHLAAGLWSALAASDN
ncbi:MAG: hypothetical protein JJU36_10610 [Phycisphaeraceae bacterium]|nr:hypothetical protein [Phycisphaeraceae bacterium]